jgi:hypothetical protein
MIITSSLNLSHNTDPKKSLNFNNGDLWFLSGQTMRILKGSQNFKKFAKIKK